MPLETEKKNNENNNLYNNINVEINLSKPIYT
jgi:hypothetical protein